MSEESVHPARDLSPQRGFTLHETLLRDFCLKQELVLFLGGCGSSGTIAMAEESGEPVCLGEWPCEVRVGADQGWVCSVFILSGPRGSGAC